MRDLHHAHSDASTIVIEKTVLTKKTVEIENNWFASNKKQDVEYNCKQVPKYEEWGSSKRFGVKKYSDGHVIVDIYVSVHDLTYSDILRDFKTFDCQFKIRKEKYRLSWYYG